MNRLDGKIAVITGGARGMGASHAKRFVEEGAKVVITDILTKEGEELADQLGENAMFIQHDVTNGKDWVNVIEKTESVFGSLNILINNAGKSHMETIENHSEEAFKKIIDINQLSVFLGMKTSLPSMRKAGGGSIVNISSLSGIKAQEENVAYNAAKYAVTGMTKTAALEFAKYGIRVNSVHPGIIKTPMIDIEEHQDSLQEMTNTIPLGRAGLPSEVTQMVLFLASDESSHSTGSEFLVDGGLAIL